MDNFSQRRIPKRKDRINLIWVVSMVALVILLIGLFIPWIGDLFFDRLILVFALGLFVLFLGVSVFQRWSWGNSWQTFAEQNGLRCELKKPHGLALIKWPVIEGVFQGYPIQVKRFTRGSGRYKKIYTAIQLSLRDPVGSSLEISKSTWLSGFKSVFSPTDLQTVQLGELELDRKLRVRSDSDTFARSVLSSYDIQQRLVEIVSQAPEMGVTVQGRELNYSERTSVTDRAYLYALLGTVTSFAAYLERYSRDTG